MIDLTDPDQTTQLILNQSQNNNNFSNVHVRTLQSHYDEMWSDKSFKEMSHLLTDISTDTSADRFERRTKEWVAENYDNSLANKGRRDSYIFTGPSWAQVSSLPFKWYKSFSTEGGIRSPSIISNPKWKHNFGKINNDHKDR